jgi:hypothetical protein
MNSETKTKKAVIFQQFLLFIKYFTKNKRHLLIFNLTTDMAIKTPSSQFLIPLPYLVKPFSMNRNKPAASFCLPVAA